MRLPSKRKSATSRRAPEEEREKHKVVSDLLAQANRFDRSKRAREDIKAMEALLTKYEALTSEIAQVTAGLSPIDPKTVEKVTDLEREIEIAETVAKAGAAQISMVALAGDRHVLLDGEDISLGESPQHTFPFSPMPRVEVPGQFGHCLPAPPHPPKRSRALRRNGTSLSTCWQTMAQSQ